MVTKFIGASRPLTGSPMGLPTFFFFFFPGSGSSAASPQSSVGPHVVKKCRIGLIFCRSMHMDSLQVQLKNESAVVIFFLSYLSKITQKHIPLTDTH